MGAKGFWTRQYADNLVEAIGVAFGKASFIPLDFIEETIVCGDIRRDPDTGHVKNICFVHVIPDTLEESQRILKRHQVRSNVMSELYVPEVRSFKLYDFVELPDGSGTVSWLFTTRSYLGSALVHATGPVPFVKLMEVFCGGQGLHFGASGLKVGGVKLLTPTEEEFFKQAHAQYIPPSFRDSIKAIIPM